MTYIISTFKNIDGTLIELSVSTNQQALCSCHEVRRRMIPKTVDNIRNALTPKPDTISGYTFLYT